MAQLTVRKLDDDLVHRLKVRAAKHRRSAEAEHRAILEEALLPDGGDFWDRAAEHRRATRSLKIQDSSELIREARDRRNLGDV